MGIVYKATEKIVVVDRYDKEKYCATLREGETFMVDSFGYEDIDIVFTKYGEREVGTISYNQFKYAVQKLSPHDWCPQEE